MTKEREACLKGLARQFARGWKDLSLLDRALTHRSYANENPLPDLQDNERLEFLGDAVLELCVSDMLIKAFPSSREGQLSKLRASLVNERSLAEMARRFHLGDFLLLGKGEEVSGGREKNSLLADTFEAVVAALYLDRGFDKTHTFVSTLFSALIAEGTGASMYRDYKTTLQERTLSHFKDVPHYTLTGAYGPDHDKRFEITLTLKDVLRTSGTGRNKKEAEQQAAKKALEILHESGLLTDSDHRRSE